MYQASGRALRWMLTYLPFLVNNKMNAWYKQREMPRAPENSFGAWYKKNHKK
jgi:L-lactate dehydrogenase complex protein LldF